MQDSVHNKMMDGLIICLGKVVRKYGNVNQDYSVKNNLEIIRPKEYKAVSLFFWFFSITIIRLAYF